MTTSTSPLAESDTPRVNLFGMRISNVTMIETVAKLLAWCGEPRGEACRFVVTPNTDHAVLFQRSSELRAAYDEASLVLADGAPLVVASKLFGQNLPERVAGSDLVPSVFAAAQKPLRVFLLGAAPGIADEAGRRIEREWQGVKVVGVYSPPMGFEHDAEENARIFAMMQEAAPDLVVVGLGAPRQELWVHKHQRELPAKVAICAGATIDFLSGHRRRSPIWMQRFGLEWLHRVCTEPRRLAGRYARDAWVFPQLMWRKWRRPLA